jgi:hypothetical protein
LQSIPNFQVETGGVQSSTLVKTGCNRIEGLLHTFLCWIAGVHRQRVRSYFLILWHKRRWEILTQGSFAMMEMAKTIATIFRLFRFDRETEEPSETREGFIVKIAECRVRISLRD